MHEVAIFAALLVTFSCILTGALLGLIRVSKLGRPRIRFIVLLATLGTAFSVFWAPLAALGPVDPGDGANGSATVLGIPSFPHPDPNNASDCDPNRTLSFDERPARFGIQAGGFPDTSATRRSAILVISSNTTSLPGEQGNETLSIVGPSPIFPRNGPGDGQDPYPARAVYADGVRADADAFWAFTGAPLVLAIAFVAIQMTIGRRHILSRVGARRCRDRKLLSLVYRLSREFCVRMPRVYLCNGTPNAFVVGFPASLVISERLRDCLSDAELELAVRHELSHIKNRDLLLKPVLQSLRILFFYNPAVHLVVRRMLDERELLADSSSTGSRARKFDLMTALVKIHDEDRPDGRTINPMQGVSALRARGRHGQLTERFENLFTTGRARPLRAFSICVLIFFANISILGIPPVLLRASASPAEQSAFTSNVQMPGHSPPGMGPVPSIPMPDLWRQDDYRQSHQTANLSAILSDPQFYAGEFVLVPNITVISAGPNTLLVTDGTGTATMLVEHPAFAPYPGMESGQPWTFGRDLPRNWTQR